MELRMIDFDDTPMVGPMLWLVRILAYLEASLRQRLWMIEFPGMTPFFTTAQWARQSTKIQSVLQVEKQKQPVNQVITEYRQLWESRFRGPSNRI